MKQMQTKKNSSIVVAESGSAFKKQLSFLEENHKRLIQRKNIVSKDTNGIITRYKFPVLTNAHVPVDWRYDLNPDTNPYLMERFGINSVFNVGAIKWNNKYLLMARVEGSNRKSFFAIAESDHGTENFRFRKMPLVLPETDRPDVNVYDMRLTAHEDGWVYGVFCTERKDETCPDDTTAAIANAGIIRTKDMIHWTRLPDLISSSNQQRNVVLHPEFVGNKYAMYTRPQEGFIETGKGGGISLGFIDNIEHPEVKNEQIINPKIYHTIYEYKNGLGPPPIKTIYGWLQLAHGTRQTAAGLRYVLYMFMTDLKDISKVIYQPGGYLSGHDQRDLWNRDPRGHGLQYPGPGICPWWYCGYR